MPAIAKGKCRVCLVKTESKHTKGGYLCYACQITTERVKGFSHDSYKERQRDDLEAREARIVRLAERAAQGLPLFG